MRLQPLDIMVNLSSEKLLLTLWVGSLWAIGYLAVPMAFATIGDITIAGSYAGKLFSTVSMVGLACGTVLLISKFITAGLQALTFWRLWVLVLMISLTLLFSFYLHAEIETVQYLISQGNDTVLERFSLLHMISENVYMVISLLGLALVVSTDLVDT